MLLRTPGPQPHCRPQGLGFFNNQAYNTGGWREVLSAVCPGGFFLLKAATPPHGAPKRPSA